MARSGLVVGPARAAAPTREGSPKGRPGVPPAGLGRSLPLAARRGLGLPAAAVRALHWAGALDRVQGREEL